MVVYGHPTTILRCVDQESKTISKPVAPLPPPLGAEVEKGNELDA